MKQECLLKNNYGSFVITNLGANILDFYVNSSKENVIWTKSRDKIINGGIPVCFPRFADESVNSNIIFHGFARNRIWDIVEIIERPDYASITMTLPNMEPLQNIELFLTATITDRLTVELKVINNSSSDFAFSEAFHTYFNISNIENIYLTGLDNGSFIDKTDNKKQKIQEELEWKINKFTDHIFYRNKNTVTINDKGFNRSIIISKENSNTTVVWNPFKIKIDYKLQQDEFNSYEAQSDDYKTFICVESANSHTDFITLKPQQSHVMKSIIQVAQ